MDLKVVEKILNLISESDVNEVTIEEGEFKIKVKKQPDVINKESGGSMPMMYMPQPGMEMQMPQAPQQVPSPAAGAAQGGEKEGSEQEEASANTQTIKSPIVGTFYESPSPESDPYVNIGDSVSKGQTLCIVEAMKIMNEVESEVAGKIVKRYVNDGQPVEYDQPLFEIELTS